MCGSKKIYWRITFVISILFGLGSILWTYLDGWAVISKKPTNKKYSQGELVTALNDLEEKLRLSRRQGQENQTAFNAALLIGLVLLYFSLIPAFQSFVHPLTIMTAIPLAMISAVWSLLITNKTQSHAANMGLILLAGIVVKNSILLIDFIEMAKARGLPTVEALRESVRVRTRPILMTAFGTAVGMLPIALERAIGLERLSPLAVVAIGGLMVSTFLTLLYVPIFYTIFEDAVVWMKKAIAKLRGRSKGITTQTIK